MNFFIKTEKKGSALLVVLGFLSFMIISAVSFSIYMRIERQASSNYRHSITARHLLESSLYRAMDEVDADLRGNSTVNTAVKFPDHWEGRVFTSKSNTPEIEDARVLSLEALSFLPASLVNDARYYSKSTPQQPTYGTKWRRMSMPIEGLVDIENNRARSSGNKSYVGRYAYICVNLSDMFNINGCTNVVRSTSNLVSIASLFSTPSMADNFSKQAGMDVHYATLQDFYACMAVANKNFFGGPSDSPYIQFLKDGKNISFNDSFNHLLVTDGFAKVPPALSTACNLTINPPFAPGQLGAGVGGVGPSMDPVFSAKIREIFPEAATIAQNGWPFQAMLADYLSKDSVGVMRLDAPSSKLAPMICQVRLAAPITPNISSEIQGNPPNESIVYSLNLVSDVNAMNGGLGLQVRVCFPFKNVEPRIRPYTLKVDGFIRVDKTAQKPELTSQIALDAANDTGFTGTATITPRAIDGVGDAQTVQNKCYQWVPVTINIPAAPIKMADSKGAVFNGFNAGTKINVTLVITSMKVQIGTVIYDSTPETPPGPSLPDMPKLYFQTGQANIVAGNPGNPWPMPYVWDSLEVPDPRFNHYVANWVNNSEDPVKNSEGIHKITKDLLGLDGRDADIFMASSGAEKLQSVGELGFIVRPYKYDPLKGMKQVDFRVKKGLEPANDDSDAFFRTIRLYDQADKTRDKVYENFYMALDAEGTLPLSANVRVNPLTSVGPIIGCALDRIPYNFNIASAGSILPKQNFTEGTLKNGWLPFVDKWANIFTNEVRTVGLNTSFQRTISDFYGDGARMGWYSPEKEARLTIFKGGFVAPAPVYEIDRKMMYAFSLDSMSDRQQLFLYVFQAESVAPISFAEMRSLAGGRAVALVWRDPYPKGSTPNNPAGLAGSWYENAASGGSKGYHEHKVLFFKQLDN
jgi:hypothetical protein